MAHRLLVRLVVPVPVDYSVRDDAAYLGLFRLAQLDLPRRPVLLEPVPLCGARDGDEALSGDPGEGDLRSPAALLRGEFLDLLDDGTVLVEILALVFGGCGPNSVSILVCFLSPSMASLTFAAEVIRRKVFGAVEGKVLHQPAVSQRAECHEGNAQLFGSIDQAAGFVDGLKRRVLGLNGIDLGNFLRRQYAI